MAIGTTGRKLGLKFNWGSRFASHNRTNMRLRQTDNAVVNTVLTVLIHPLLLPKHFTNN